MTKTKIVAFALQSSQKDLGKHKLAKHCKEKVQPSDCNISGVLKVHSVF